MKDRASWIGRVLLLLLSVLIPNAVMAQPVYVGASLLADISRFTTIEVDPSTFSNEVTGGGETFGFSLVVGTALGERWGVELEFVRPGLLEHSVERQIELLPPGVPVVAPDFDLRIRDSQLGAPHHRDPGGLVPATDRRSRRLVLPGRRGLRADGAGAAGGVRSAADRASHSGHARDRRAHGRPDGRSGGAHPHDVSPPR